MKFLLMFHDKQPTCANQVSLRDFISLIGGRGHNLNIWLLLSHWHWVWHDLLQDLVFFHWRPHLCQNVCHARCQESAELQEGAESLRNRRLALLSFFLFWLHRIQLPEENAIMWRNASCWSHSWALSCWFGAWQDTCKCSNCHIIMQWPYTQCIHVTGDRVETVRLKMHRGCGCHDGNLGLVPGMLLMRSAG